MVKLEVRSIPASGFFYPLLLLNTCHSRPFRFGSFHSVSFRSISLAALSIRPGDLAQPYSGIRDVGEGFAAHDMAQPQLSLFPGAKGEDAHRLFVLEKADAVALQVATIVRKGEG